MMTPPNTPPEFPQAPRTPRRQRTALPPELERLIALMPDTITVVGGPQRAGSHCFEVEREAMAAMSPQRAAEFASGRSYARAAIFAHQQRGRHGQHDYSQHGDGELPIAVPIAASRAPVWPRGLVGSLTHSDTWYAAAVAADRDQVALGIDLETKAVQDPGIWDIVLHPTEARSRPWVRFSAKESLFKLYNPLMHRWLDFTEAVVELTKDYSDGTFASGKLRFRLLVPGPAALSDVTGVWVQGSALVATAAWLDRSAWT